MDIIMHKNLVKTARVVLEISSRKDRHTDRHSHQYTSQRSRGRSKGTIKLNMSRDLYTPPDGGVCHPMAITCH